MVEEQYQTKFIRMATIVEPAPFFDNDDTPGQSTKETELSIVNVSKQSNSRKKQEQKL
jgi:hypothetical protein